MPESPSSPSPAGEPLLLVEGLRIGYRLSGRMRVAVDGASLRLEQGEALAVIGKSGSGKTTLTSALLGLLPDNARVLGGSVRILGRDVHRFRGGRDRRALLADVGYVPQDPAASLNPVRSIRSQLAEAIRVRRVAVRREEVERIAIETLRRVGIPDPARVLDQYPHQLSGGLLQRVLIAAAIVARPRLLIADEPTSALDVTTQKEILDLIDDLRTNLGMTILFVTHDLSIAAERCNRILVVHDGRVAEEGPTGRILHAPSDPYTRSLLADLPRRVPEILQERSARGPQSSGESHLVVDGVSAAFTRRDGSAHLAVDDARFAIARGTTHALVGESGSGKTTISRLVLGLVAARTGTVSLDGQPIDYADRRALRDLRRRVQYVYQNPFGSLDPEQSVRRIVEEPLRHYGRLDRPARRGRVDALLESVGLPARTAEQRPGELSGGQRQRVAIARAIATSPEVLILDEPTSALDVSVQSQILRLLRGLQQELGLTYLFVSHDLRVVAEIADTVTVLRGGVTVESGRVADVLGSPRDDYTRRLLASIPLGLGAWVTI